MFSNSYYIYIIWVGNTAALRPALAQTWYPGTISHLTTMTGDAWSDIDGWPLKRDHTCARGFAYIATSPDHVADCPKFRSKSGITKLILKHACVFNDFSSMAVPVLQAAEIIPCGQQRPVESAKSIRTIAVAALAPCVTKTAATTVLT